ncbi:hypothetical protein MMC25_002596 [Agyrium rufum]|nr:hypothetical protein [Agyrium rufum]
MATTASKACVLYGPRDLRLEDVQLPPPQTDELQIAIKNTGICGSDLHYFQDYRNGDILVHEPFALGHESAGIVVATGSEVGDFQVGDHIALEVGVPCSSCSYCKRGRYNLCARMRFSSSAKSVPHPWGTLQERVNHPAKWCWKLPRELSLVHGALLEPFSVALHALDRAGLFKADPKDKSNPGRSALIFGAGAVGALTAAALRLSVPDMTVVIADIDEKRIAFATSNHFADGGFAVPRPMQRAETIQDKLLIAKEVASISHSVLQSLSPKHTDSPGYDVVFECTGVEACVQASIYAACPGSKVMLIGMGTPIQTLPVSAAALREVDIIGVFRYANTYAKGVELLTKAQKDLEAGEKIPDVTKLVTHRIQGLHSAKEAFEIAGKPIDSEGAGVIKVMIEN